MSTMCLAVEFLRGNANGIQYLCYEGICSDSPNEVRMLRVRTTMTTGPSSDCAWRNESVSCSMHLRQHGSVAPSLDVT